MKGQPVMLARGSLSYVSLFALCSSHRGTNVLQCILDPVEVMTQMSPLYLQRVMGDSFQSTFLKRRE